MTTYMLFCVAAMPLTVIDNLLASKTPGISFSLATSFNQSNFEGWGNKPPITSDIYTNDKNEFINATMDEIIAFFDSKFPPPVPGYGGALSEGGFVILDERSTADETVQVWFNHQPWMTVPHETLDWDNKEDEYDAQKMQWYDWRVKFRDVGDITLTLDDLFEQIPLLFKKQYLSGDGVYDVRRMKYVEIGIKDEL